MILHINDVHTDLDPTASHSFMKIVAILLYLINTSAIIPMLDIISQLSVRDSSKGFPNIVLYINLFQGIVPALIVIIVSRSIDAATHYEEALTTINYRYNSRMQMGTSCTVDPELQASPKNSLEMIPVHLTNSYEPESPAREKRMVFAENASLEKIPKHTATTGTRTTVSGASSRTMGAGSRGESIVEII